MRDWLDRDIAILTMRIEQFRHNGEGLAVAYNRVSDKDGFHGWHGIGRGARHAAKNRRGALERGHHKSAPLHFYRTASMPCPYVDGRIERKLVTELVGRDCTGFYNELSRGGFRRSHHLAYRPACAGCNACVPVRIVALDFVAGRSLRRVAARNADVTVRIAEPKASVEQFRVFTRYQHSRHHDSEMASMTYGDYRAMIEDSPVATCLVELRGPDGRILGICLVDLLDDGLSAVYSFFDPSDHRRSLGSLSYSGADRGGVSGGRRLTSIWAIGSPRVRRWPTNRGSARSRD